MGRQRSQRFVSIFELIEEPRTTDLQRSQVYQEALRQKISSTLLEYMSTVSGYAVEHEEWQEHAECKGNTDLFFPPLDDDFLKTEITRTNRSNEANRNKRVNKAKKFCAICPVEFECLSWALRMGSHYDEAICGGMTWFERKRYLRRLRDSIRRNMAEFSSTGYSWVDEGPDMVRITQLPSEVPVDVRSRQLSLVS